MQRNESIFERHPGLSTALPAALMVYLFGSGRPFYERALWTLGAGLTTGILAETLKTKLPSLFASPKEFLKQRIQSEILGIPAPTDWAIQHPMLSNILWITGISLPIATFSSLAARNLYLFPVMTGMGLISGLASRMMQREGEKILERHMKKILAEKKFDNYR